jgi:hypothetical protein
MSLNDGLSAGLGDQASLMSPLTNLGTAAGISALSFFAQSSLTSLVLSAA